MDHQSNFSKILSHRETERKAMETEKLQNFLKSHGYAGVNIKRKRFDPLSKRLFQFKYPKVMTKGALVRTLAEQHELKGKVASGIIDSLAALATTEVKKTGIFTIPGLCRIKTRVKPATKAGTKVMFGKEIKVKARPAKTVVKAFPVAALKAQI